MNERSPNVKLGTIEQALTDLAAGKAVIVADDPDRENEVDFVVAAQNISPEMVALLIRHGSGVICAAMTGEVCDRLDLPPMRDKNEDYKQTAYTVSCDAHPSEGTTTGISAADRAKTLAVLADPAATPSRLSRPGHVFPLRAVAGGVFKRGGHTEASTDLTRLAGLPPVAAIVEIVHDDGRMVRLHELTEFLRQHNLPDFTVITIEDLKKYREAKGDSAELADGPLMQRSGPARLPTKQGDFGIYAYRHHQREHIALVKGDVANAEDVLVRIHSECVTGDAFDSLRCDCGPQLRQAQEQIEQAGRGIIIYLDGHEGRGIGIYNKVAAYQLQDTGLDTYDANTALGLAEDAREYSAAAYILQDLGVASVRILSNNPDKPETLRKFGLTVRETVPLVVPHTKHNLNYLKAKAEHGHAALLAEIINE